MPNSGSRWLRHTLIAVVVLVVVGAGIIAGFVATYGLDTNTTERVPAGGTKVVPVTLTDFDVTPGTLEVSRGTQLLLDVVNRGDQVHDLAVTGGPGTRMLAPGDSQRLNLGVVTQRLQFWCTVDSHKVPRHELGRTSRPTSRQQGLTSRDPIRPISPSASHAHESDITTQRRGPAPLPKTKE